MTKQIDQSDDQNPIMPELAEACKAHPEYRIEEGMRMHVPTTDKKAPFYAWRVTHVEYDARGKAFFIEMISDIRKFFRWIKSDDGWRVYELSKEECSITGLSSEAESIFEYPPPPKWVPDLDDFATLSLLNRRLTKPDFYLRPTTMRQNLDIFTRCRNCYSLKGPLIMHEGSLIHESCLANDHLIRQSRLRMSTESDR